jgi:hypothetical protein
VVVVATCVPADDNNVTVAPGTTPLESRTVPERESCCAALSDAHIHRTASSGRMTLARKSAFMLRTSIECLHVVVTTPKIRPIIRVRLGTGVGRCKPREFRRAAADVILKIP